MSEFPAAAYDRWATGGRYQKHPAEVYCGDTACVEYAEPVQVDYEEEYGAGWYTPEECPACGGPWLEDKPKGEDEDA